MGSPVLLCRETVKEIHKNIDTFLFDCDGVLWKSGAAIPGAAEVVQQLHRAGKRIFYVTNNSTKSRHEYVDKCNRFGFPCSLDQVVSTAYLVAEHLRSIGFSKTVYLLGSTGISQELDNVGIRHIGLGPDILLDDALDGELSEFRPDPQVGAVVVGFDGHFSYPKLFRAANYLNDPQVMFVATNRDERFPTSSAVFPGTGSLVSSVCVASGREPLVLGKPSVAVFDTLARKYNLHAHRTLMVGDNYQTDVVLGRRCGLQTLAVMTGVTQPHHVQEMQRAEWPDQQQVPHFYCQSLADLLDQH